MAEIRIAIALGGGVSLGSFIGGALAGAIDALAQEQQRGANTLTIDCLSGASAGSLTLVGALRAMLTAGGAPAQAVCTMQRSAWVDGISLRALVTGRLDLEHTDFSHDDDELAGLIGTPSTRGGALLDRRVIDALVQQHVCGALPALQKSDLVANRVLVSCSMTSLTGMESDRSGQVTVGRPAAMNALRQCQYGHHRRMLIDCTGGADVPALDRGPLSPETLADLDDRPVWGLRATDPATWIHAGAAGAASGAFPFAFSPVTVGCRKTEFPTRLGPWYDRLPVATDGQEQKVADLKPVSFVDGGMIDNYPLREAIALARLRDEASGFTGERWILFIAAEPGDSYVPPVLLRPETELLAQSLGMGGLLVNALRGSAAFDQSPVPATSGAAMLKVVGISSSQTTPLNGRGLFAFGGFCDVRLRQSDFNSGLAVGFKTVADLFPPSLEPALAPLTPAPGQITKPEDLADFRFWNAWTSVVTHDVEAGLPTLATALPAGILVSLGAAQVFGDLLTQIVDPTISRRPPYSGIAVTIGFDSRALESYTAPGRKLAPNAGLLTFTVYRNAAGLLGAAFAGSSTATRWVAVGASYQPVGGGDLVVEAQLQTDRSGLISKYQIAIAPSELARALTAWEEGNQSPLRFEVAPRAHQDFHRLTCAAAQVRCPAGSWSPTRIWGF